MRILDRVAEWLFRERPIERKLLAGGIVCLATVGAGPGWSLATRVLGHEVTISRIQPLPEMLSWAIGLAGAMLLLASVLLVVVRHFDDRQIQRRRVVLAIEQRGLRDTTDTPMVAAIPSMIKGRRQELVIDMRDRIKDGVVTDPETALGRVLALPQSLEILRNGRSSADIVTVYGGLSPVPFTFLAGVLLDDESHIVTLDWDRNRGLWRPLDGVDDGESFKVSGEYEFPQDMPEVAVAVSVSYLVDAKSVRASLPDIPLVELTLPRRGTDNHWSEAKQARLAKEFLAAMIQLADMGVRKIHLFLAAQNSAAFRLGRAYDKRNLPKLLVYQYQKGLANEHPWAVVMPVESVQTASIHTVET